MTTTLLNAEIELSKQIGDFWSSTTTGTGSSSTNIQDTALKAKANDWIDGDREMYIMITDSSADNSTDEEERKATALDNSTGDLTVLALSGDPGDGKTYRVHRLFTASDKRRALVYAARRAFPDIHTKVNSETLRMGNWLLNGDMQKWTTGTAAPDDWTASTLTVAKNSTAPYYILGDYSAKLNGSAGNLYQDGTLNPALLQLAGKTVTFEARAWCNTASDFRLQIYDGTTTTSSDYHDGGSAWDDEETDTLRVEATIAEEPTEITFRLMHDAAAGTIYVQDARVISGVNDRVYVGYLSLAQDMPFLVEQAYEGEIRYGFWQGLHGSWVDKDDYLHVPNGTNDEFLRIRGIGYLDFIDSSGDSGTDWDDTVTIDSPQTDILVAQAALYLYQTISMPNFDSGTREEYMQMIGYWENELRKRKGKFGMDTPSASTDWGI